MLRKNKQDAKGPSWTEVILAAVLSAIVGLVVGAAYLVLKPVQTVKAVPKDASANAIFYIAGSTDVNHDSLSEVKKSFLNGETVELTEGQLNAFLSSLAKPAAPAAAKPGDKGAPAPSQNGVVPGALNARIAEGRLQLAAPVDISVYGFTTNVIVQASGTIDRDASLWVFDAERILVGGMQVQHIPFLKGLVLKKLLLAQDVPADITAAWSKLTSVSVEGSKLRLKAP